MAYTTFLWLFGIISQQHKTTLDIVFSVPYYLELCNGRNNCCISHVLPQEKCQIGCLDVIHPYLRNVTPSLISLNPREWMCTV